MDTHTFILFNSEGIWLKVSQLFLYLLTVISQIFFLFDVWGPYQHFLWQSIQLDQPQADVFTGHGLPQTLESESALLSKYVYTYM